MRTDIANRISSLPPRFHPLIHENQSTMDISHLSGATMTDLTVDPKIHVIAASEAGSKRTSMDKASSKRCSVASTTKSELRRSNNLLVEMLQNIQAELATHRTIMLDIQQRVSHLEHEAKESPVKPHNQTPHKAALHALEANSSPQKKSTLVVPPESQFWWQTCKPPFTLGYHTS